jgi:Ca-activated chloride channel family protein
VALIRAALPKRSTWKRHVPVALLLASLVGLSLAAARPKVSSTVPLGRTSIILALDVSRSMCATDVEPNRLTVAQEAARNFVKEQPKGTRIGIVAFAGFAQLIVRPTTDHKALVDAINNLTTARGTVIGAATLEALNAIAELNPQVAPVDTSAVDTGSAAGAPGSAGSPGATTPPDAATGPAASGNKDYVPDIVVLLTDGANTRGVDPVTAAQQAVERRVRVYTIGFGTTTPANMVCTRAQLGSDIFGQDPAGPGPNLFPGSGGGGAGGAGGAGGGNFRRFLTIDEPTLQKVADMTGGRYYRAVDADQLSQVFRQLPQQVVLQKQRHEVSSTFVAAGVLLALAAIGLSLLWNRSAT